MPKTPYYRNGMIYYMGFDGQVHRFPISEFVEFQPTFKGPAQFTTQTDVGKITVHLTIDNPRDLLEVIENGTTRLSTGS